MTEPPRPSHSRLGTRRELLAFEHRHAPLRSRDQFFRRQIRYALFGLLLVLGSITLGMAGYHFTEDMPWIDSLLNAAMILFGEGPVNVLYTDAGKLFASFYAKFSGVAFVTMVAVVFAPLAHRFLHRFHLEMNDKE